jgi:hypothetical protein
VCASTAPTFHARFSTGILLPVWTHIRAIIREREDKLREAQLMVGISDAAIFLGWMLTYIIIYSVIALLAMLFSLATLFQFSNQGYSEFSKPGLLGGSRVADVAACSALRFYPLRAVFVTFFMFGVSNAALAYLLSVFFTSARVGAAIGTMIYLGSFMPGVCV